MTCSLLLLGSNNFELEQLRGSSLLLAGEVNVDYAQHNNSEASTFLPLSTFGGSTGFGRRPIDFFRPDATRRQGLTGLCSTMTIL